MATAEELADILRHDMFQAGLVEALMVGVYTSIFLFTVYSLVSEHGIKVAYRPLIALMIVMYISAIIHLAGFWYFIKKAFVDNGRSEQDILASLGSDTVVGAALAVASRGAVMLIADGIMIWRCWRLYSQSWLVIALPLILVLGELSTLITRIIYGVRDRELLTTTETTRSLSIAHIAFTLAATVLITLLIIYRIIRVGSGTAKRYRHIIGIILESSALYACALIIYIPFPLHPVLFDTIPNAVLTPMGGIASTLVIARVANSRSVDERNHAATGIPGARRASSLRFRWTSAGAGTRHFDAETGFEVPESATRLGTVAERNDSVRDGGQSKEEW